MIWFTCKQCGKAHGRPESSVGTVVFCECGQGNTVPWESNTTEPARAVDLPAAQAPLAPLATPVPALPVAGPKLEPLKFDAVPVPAPSPLPGRRGEREAVPDEPDRRRPRGRPAPFRSDPNFCLNHPAVASQKTCIDCREAFCPECVLTFQGDTLCGPCKNFRVRTMEEPPRISGFALSSLFVALFAGPLALCVVVSRANPYWALVTLLPQMAALVLGIMGLRTIEVNPRLGGWAMALTGLLTASIASFVTVVVVVFAPALPGLAR